MKNEPRKPLQRLMAADDLRRLRAGREEGALSADDQGRPDAHGERAAPRGREAGRAHRSRLPPQAADDKPEDHNSAARRRIHEGQRAAPGAKAAHDPAIPGHHRRAHCAGAGEEGCARLDRPRHQRLLSPPPAGPGALEAQQNGRPQRHDAAQISHDASRHAELRRQDGIHRRQSVRSGGTATQGYR